MTKVLEIIKTQVMLQIRTFKGLVDDKRHVYLSHDTYLITPTLFLSNKKRISAPKLTWQS